MPSSSPAAAPPAAPVEDEVNFSEVLHKYLSLVSKRRWLILSLVTLVLAATAAWTYTRVPIFSTTAKAFVERLKLASNPDFWKPGLAPKEEAQEIAVDRIRGLLVARAGVTSRAGLQELHRQIADVGSTVLGCLLDDLDLERRGYGRYYGGKRYGYGRYGRYGRYGYSYRDFGEKEEDKATTS